MDVITIIIILLTIATLFIYGLVKWWFRGNRDDDYIKKDDYLIDDFYTHGKRIDDV